MSNYRVHSWLNTETMQEFFGIQKRIKREWVNCCHGSEPLFFDTKIDAQTYIDELDD